jgi:hypothetical protein
VQYRKKAIILCAVQFCDKGRLRLGGRNGRLNITLFIHNYALAAYYSKSDKGNKWCFSFIKIEHVTFVKDGKIVQEKDYSSAKRYSFVVGKNKYNRTAYKKGA